ncbi:MAG TPA: YetF domain-containing protein [Puia sp.]|jgi:uncharacterized membrane protein YcaP (DUF421 family)|nr:YetF domain-containing protein [Puia sp.]
MDESEYSLWDWHRILFGNAPVEFLLETFFRTVITYIFLLAVVAWLGKRMSGRVTITELGIAIMLGAIVAPPMETPERGVLQGGLILLLVLVLHRSTAWLSVKDPKAEKIIQGSLDICIRDGVVDVAVLRKMRVSRAQLFAVLRMNNIYNLGQVERLYMEASGTFSIFEAGQPKPGLSLLPPGDDAVHAIQQHPEERLKACISCGKTKRLAAKGEPCPNCGNIHWDTAVL